MLIFGTMKKAIFGLVGLLGCSGIEIERIVMEPENISPLSCMQNYCDYSVMGLVDGKTIVASGAGVAQVCSDISVRIQSAIDLDKKIILEGAFVQRLYSNEEIFMIQSVDLDGYKL
jgi:hypothetical protein